MRSDSMVATVTESAGDENFPKYQLQGELIARGEKDQRLDVRVPVPDPVAQRKKRHQRRRYRQDDPEQKLEVAAPRRCVRPPASRSGRRSSKKERADDDHEGVHGVGSDHRPERVQHAEVAHHQVGRDQSAGQVQGDDQDLQDGLAAAQVFSRQRVGCQHGQEHVQRDAADHVDQAVSEAAPRSPGWSGCGRMRRTSGPSATAPSALSRAP